jgi:regulator of replication initiation timing
MDITIKCLVDLTVKTTQNSKIKDQVQSMHPEQVSLRIENKAIKYLSQIYWVVNPRRNGMKLSDHFLLRIARF